MKKKTYCIPRNSFIQNSKIATHIRRTLIHKSPCFPSVFSYNTRAYAYLYIYFRKSFITLLWNTLLVLKFIEKYKRKCICISLTYFHFIWTYVHTYIYIYTRKKELIHQYVYVRTYVYLCDRKRTEKVGYCALLL